jgi:Asp-tRNA(Asn)/Glu-tRNA(Gln) amidotransferase A subunit family amidase
MLDVLAGFDERDPYTAAAFIAGKPTGGSYAANLSVEKIKSARIGVLSETFGSDSDPDCRSVNMVMKNTLQKLQENGTTLINVEIPNLKHYLQTTFMYPQRSRSDLDAFFSQHPYLKTNTTEIYEKKQYHPALDLFEDIATGPGDPQKDTGFTDRLFARDELQRLIITVMAKNALDALAFPDVQVPAPSLDDVLAQRWSGATFPTNTLIASQSLLPAISIPAGLTEGHSGLPVGLELLGLPYREQLLLELAYGVEKVTMARKPPTL